MPWNLTPGGLDCFIYCLCAKGSLVYNTVFLTITKSERDIQTDNYLHTVRTAQSTDKPGLQLK